MSNKVGELYNSVIETVIKDAKTELDDRGDVDPSVLDMLTKAWRRRLGEMNVIKDPGWNAEARRDLGIPTGPASIASSTAAVLQNFPLPPASEGLPMPSEALHFVLPPVKDEGGADISISGAPGYNPPAGTNPPRAPPSTQYPLYNGVKEEPFDMLQSDRNKPAYNPLNSTRPDDTSRTSNPSPSLASPSLASPNLASPGLAPPSLTTQLAGGASVRAAPELQQQMQDVMNRQSKLPQTDGPQEEELNSDLDDSEDELADSNDEEEGEQTQIMLCLYEKVHKVKTRWKYTLKDGVANVNGLDYVFAKASGESEW